MLANYLGISPERIEIISDSQGTASTTNVAIHIKEKKGEASSQSVADAFVQKVSTNDPSLIASGLNVNSASVSYVPAGDPSPVLGKREH